MQFGSERVKGLSNQSQDWVIWLRRRCVAGDVSDLKKSVNPVWEFFKFLVFAVDAGPRCRVDSRFDLHRGGRSQPTP